MLRQIDCFSSYETSSCDFLSPVCIDKSLSLFDSIRKLFRISYISRSKYLPMDFFGLVSFSSIAAASEIHAKFLYYRLKRIKKKNSGCNRVNDRIAVSIPKGRNPYVESGNSAGKVDSSDPDPKRTVRSGECLKEPNEFGELLLEGIQ